MSGPRADGTVAPIPPIVAATGADLADVEVLVAAAGLTLAGLATCVRDGTAVICRGPDGCLLGVAATERHGSSALLRSVAVHRPARGHGLGHALVERALADARAAGAREVAPDRDRRAVLRRPRLGAG